MADTDLQTSNPNSASSYGFGDEVVTGRRVYVDSGRTNATDGSEGTSPRRPMATLNGAINKVTANNGDHIYLMPGHSETISADAATDPGPDLTVEGVTVIGMGKGAARATFNFTDTAADFKMNAANCRIHNILFTAGVNAQVMCLEVSGVDCEVSHCEFRSIGGTNEFLISVNIGLTGADADRFWIHDSVFISDTAAATSAIAFIGTPIDVIIEDCTIRGDWSDAAIQSAVIQLDCIVRKNFIRNDNAGDHGIQFSTTATGWITGNTIFNDEYALAIDPGSCDMSGNEWGDPAVDTGTIPFPAIGLDGVTSGALPLVQSTGVRFFVDSGHADAADVAAYGTSPASPFATIDFAITQVTATNGDVIYAMPGHVETMSAAGSCNFDGVAGTHLIGLGHGTAKATFNYTNSAGDIIVSTANTIIENMLFDMTVASLTMGGTISASDFTLKDCEIITADGSAQATGIFTSSAARSKYHNCIFRATTDAGVASCIQQTGTNQGMEVIGCTFHGDYSDAAIQSSSAHTICLIRDNFIENLNAGEHAIQFSAAATGYIDGNKLVTDVKATALDKGSCKTHDNWFWDSGDVATDGAFVEMVGAGETANYNPVLGYRVRAADAVTPQNTTTTLFTITGGRILITHLSGVIGTVIPGSSNLISLTHNPSNSSTDVSLSTDLELNGFDSGTLLYSQLDGSALVGADAINGIQSDEVIGIGNFIASAGVVSWESGETIGGTVKWDMWYWPLDDGVSVVGS